MKQLSFLGRSLQISPHNIFCIGRNYAEHAHELKNAVPQEPVVFLKPLNALTADGGTIVLPCQSQNVQHEVEIVVLLEKGGKNIAEDQAYQHIAGFAVGIDVTARDLQKQAKDQGLPWTLAKGFDTFAPLSAFVPREDVHDWKSLTVTLTVNGELRQRGVACDMIFTIPFLIRYLSERFTLEAGDLIFTGTPAGVGPLKAGDRLLATLGTDLTQLTVNVV